MQNLPDENTKRFAAVLNKKIEIGRFMNALGHMTAGLAGGGLGCGMSCVFCSMKIKTAASIPIFLISHLLFCKLIIPTRSARCAMRRSKEIFRLLILLPRWLSALPNSKCLLLGKLWKQIWNIMVFVCLARLWN